MMTLKALKFKLTAWRRRKRVKRETHTVKSGAPTFWDCLWVIWKSARAAKSLRKINVWQTAACQPNNASTNGVSIDTFSAHASHIQRTRSFHASVVLCDIHGAHVVEETYQVKDVRVVDRPSLPSNSTSFSLLMKLPDHTADTQRKNVSSLEVSQSKSIRLTSNMPPSPAFIEDPAKPIAMPSLSPHLITPISMAGLPLHPLSDHLHPLNSTLINPSRSKLHLYETSGSNSALHPRTMSMRGLPASSPSLAKLPVTCSLAPTASASTVLGCRCRWCFGGVGVEKIVWGDNDDGHDVDNVIRLGGWRRESPFFISLLYTFFFYFF
ncbi:hypothetical protein BC829DRAFT_291606 [Chytridium lagenaria]|nr:hypothetical protein BC829DRAFT_291606 [Chytridium lagenaria]